VTLSHPVYAKYTRSMKTAISLSDELFAAADALADRIGMSRSELYATAVAEFLAKHNSEEVTARLNRVYASEPSGLEADVRRAQRASLGAERW
jgi:metal-responsive CopG/Arc/MetJ family transcriptional regulator